MTQPTLTPLPDIDSSQADWQEAINTNFNTVKTFIENPLPLKHASSVGTLPSASLWPCCIATAVSGGNVHLYLSDGVTWLPVSANPGLPYLSFVHRTSNGVHAGTATGGAWQTRVVNYEEADTASIGSLASNRISLPAGEYDCRILVPHFGVGVAQSKLVNYTDGQDLLTSDQVTALNSFADPQGCVFSEIRGRIYLSATKALEIQQLVESTMVNYGLGFAVGRDTYEYYTRAEFWKIR